MWLYVYIGIIIFLTISRKALRHLCGLDRLTLKLTCPLPQAISAVSLMTQIWLYLSYAQNPVKTPFFHSHLLCRACNVLHILSSIFCSTLFAATIPESAITYTHAELLLIACVLHHFSGEFFFHIQPYLYLCQIHL